MTSSDDNDDDTYKLVHGILMGSAWLVLAPIAIGASVIRRVSPITCCLNQNGFWFQIHFYCQILVVALTVAGFLVIWLGDDDGRSDDDGVRIRFLKDFWEDESDDYDNHDNDDDKVQSEDNVNNDDDEILLFPAFGWTKDDAEENIHPKIGISILALVLFQAFLGFIRPHVHPSSPPSPLPPPSLFKPPSTTNSSTKPNHTDDNKNSNIIPTINRSTMGTMMDDTNNPTFSTEDVDSDKCDRIQSNNSIDAAEADNDHDDHRHSVVIPTKPRIRVLWEWCHRCLGLALLGVAWFQCVIGLKILRK
jgi:hypothetical protein